MRRLYRFNLAAFMRYHRSLHICIFLCISYLTTNATMLRIDPVDQLLALIRHLRGTPSCREIEATRCLLLIQTADKSTLIVIIVLLDDFKR